MIRFLHITVLAVALAACLFPAGELSGRRAPGFALPDSRMQYHDLADYAGKVLILDVSQTGCPHCQKLAETLEKVKARYGDRIHILTVVNPPDNTVTVAEFIKTYKVTSPILFDCGQMAASYFKATPEYPTVSVPHLFLIDQQGFIRNDFGYTTETKDIFEGNGLHKEIDGLLAGKPAPANK